MLKYTVKSDGYFLTFTGIAGTSKEGIVISHQKSLIKQVVEDVAKSAVILIDVDDYTKEYIYYEVTNPQTGFAFTSLASFRIYVMTELNTTVSASNLFIDNWNAITNVPTLADGGLYDSDNNALVDVVAPNSFYFIVINADPIPANNTTIDGENAWEIGDIVRSTGTKWVRQPRVNQVAAYNVSYVPDPTGDVVWVTLDNVQNALDNLYQRVSVFSGTLASLSDVDLVTTAPEIGDQLVWDGIDWVPGKVGGRSLIKVISDANGTIVEPTVDGNYIIKVGTSAGWVQAGWAINDIVNLSATVWTRVYDVSTEAAGAIEIVYTLSPREGANYVWDGTVWEPIDAYEPNTSLNSVTVSNANLGDISSPPYGAPTHTGATLRGRSISKVLDDIIFKTVAHVYIAPALLPATGDINLERGTPITADLIGTYTKNEGGNLDNTDPSHPGGNELNLELMMSSVSTIVNSNTHVAGNRTASITPVGKKIPDIASAVSPGYFRVIAKTANGTPVLDNKGNATPQSANVLAQTMTRQQTYYSRYPIWVGHTTERFTIASVGAGALIESATISINPNSGSISGGTQLNNAWLQGAGVTMKQLFLSNLLANTLLSPSVGDCHSLIICPPGITVQSIQAIVGTNLVPLTYGTHYSSFIINNVTSLGGLEPRNYTCYYLRDLSSTTFTVNTVMQVTTTGTIS